VRFIVYKITSELECVILTTLYLIGSKTPTVGAPGMGICSVLFLWMFRWFILRKLAVATGDIYSFGVDLTQDESLPMVRGP
jgi:hypothetical protein